MDLDKRNKQIEKIRGEIIGKMLFVELLLNQVLSIYISADEKLKYSQFIFTAVSIPLKLKVYRQILKDKDPVFIKYSYPELPVDIEEMQEIRNHFAHSLAEIHFFGYKNRVEIFSDKISFSNAKNMEKEFLSHIANEYDLNKHRDNLDKLDKIKSSLSDIMHYYNREHSSKS